MRIRASARLPSLRLFRDPSRGFPRGAADLAGRHAPAVPPEARVPAAAQDARPQCQDHAVPSAALVAVAQRVRPVVRDAAQPASLKGALGKVLGGPFAEQHALRAAAMRAESRLAPAAQRAAVVPAASEMDHRPEVSQLAWVALHGAVVPAPEAAVLLPA